MHVVNYLPIAILFIKRLGINYKVHYVDLNVCIKVVVEVFFNLQADP